MGDGPMAKFLSSNVQDFIEVQPTVPPSNTHSTEFLSSNVQDFIEVHGNKTVQKDDENS